MKIRLIRPLPQPEYGKVIPAGVVIDAPPVLSARLLRLGIGEPDHGGEAQGSTAAAPGTTTETDKGQKTKPTRKKVKRNG